MPGTAPRKKITNRITGGMNHDQMVYEAKLRCEFNKKRQNFKGLVKLAAGKNAEEVPVDELELAASGGPKANDDGLHPALFAARSFAAGEVALRGADFPPGGIPRSLEPSCARTCLMMRARWIMRTAVLRLESDCDATVSSPASWNTEVLDLNLRVSTPSVCPAAASKISTAAPAFVRTLFKCCRRGRWCGFGSMPIAQTWQRGATPKSSSNMGRTVAAPLGEAAYFRGSKSLRICTPRLLPMSRYTCVQPLLAIRWVIRASSLRISATVELRARASSCENVDAEARREAAATNRSTACRHREAMACRGGGAVALSL